MEPIYDTLKIDNIAYREKAQAFVEGELTPGADKPDIAKVLDVQAQVEVSSAEPLEGRLMMDGTVRLFVVYCDPDGNITGFESAAGFKHTLELEGVNASMNADATPQVQTLDFNLQGPRTLAVKAVVDINCHLTAKLELRTLAGVAGVSDLQQLKNRLKLPFTTPLGNSSFMIREDMRLPQAFPFIREILCVRASANATHVSTDDGSAIIEGEAEFKILYLSDDKAMPLQELSQKFPFEQLMALPAGAGESLNARARVKSASAVPVDEDGMQLISVEANVCVDLFSLGDAEVNVTEDAYSPSVPLQCDYTTNDIRTAGNTMNQSINVSEQLQPAADAPIARVLFANARALITGYTMNGDQALLEGTLFSRVIYTCPKDEVHTLANETAFTASMPADACELECDAVCKSVTAAGGELRALVNINAQKYECVPLTLVSGASEAPNDERISGIVVYFTSDGETLWDIAKRFSTTSDEVMQLNPAFDPGSNAGGQKLVLSLKKVV